MTPPPAPTRLARLRDYVVTMLPPLVMAPAGIGNAVVVHFALQGMAGAQTMRMTWRLAGAAVSSVLLIVLFRVLDELKDADSDRALAAAGDPRYRDRPIVTGRVTIADLQALRWGVTAVLFAVNALLGLAPLLALAVVLSLFTLALHWFFWPRIKTSLILAFVTHNPLSLVVAGYLAVVAIHDFGIDRIALADAGLVCMMMWLPVAAWETSRKIRIPEDETAYETYSKVLGWKLAPLLPGLFVTGATVLLVIVGRRAGLGLAYAAVVVAAAVVPLVALARFRLRPTREHARLQPPVELFTSVANAALIVALILHHGIAFGDGPGVLPLTR